MYSYYTKCAILLFLPVTVTTLHSPTTTQRNTQPIMSATAVTGQPTIEDYRRTPCFPFEPTKADIPQAHSKPEKNTLGNHGLKLWKLG